MSAPASASRVDECQEDFNEIMEHVGRIASSPRLENLPSLGLAEHKQDEGIVAPMEEDGDLPNLQDLFDAEEEHKEESSVSPIEQAIINQLMHGNPPRTRRFGMTVALGNEDLLRRMLPDGFVADINAPNPFARQQRIDQELKHVLDKETIPTNEEWEVLMENWNDAERTYAWGEVALTKPGWINWDFVLNHGITNRNSSYHINQLWSALKPCWSRGDISPHGIRMIMSSIHYEINQLVFRNIVTDLVRSNPMPWPSKDACNVITESCKWGAVDQHQMIVAMSSLFSIGCRVASEIQGESAGRCIYKVASIVEEMDDRLRMVELLLMNMIKLSEVDKSVIKDSLFPRSVSREYNDRIDHILISHNQRLMLQADLAKQKAQINSPIIVDTLVDSSKPHEACTICHENKRCLVIVPCGHYSSCGACYKNRQNNLCPHCRTPIERVVRVFDC